MTAPSPVTPVMAGKQCIGFVMKRADGFLAYDESKSLGLYPDKSAAIAALIEARRTA